MQFCHKPRFIYGSLVSSYPGPDPAAAERAAYILVQGTEVVLPKREPLTIFRTEIPDSVEVLRIQYLGDRDGTPCYAVEIPEGASLPEGNTREIVRSLAGRVPDDELGLAAYAVQIIDFDRTTRFCGKCGTGNEQLTTERAKQCPSCGYLTYPRLSPAIIVLVVKGDEILLGRSPGFTAGMYSVLAGFVEAGETIEHAVHREVREEAGIEIRNIRYMGSEPWPFPNSLMIGFTAEYASGDLHPDRKEIEALGWFSRETLPLLPPQLSISRALIDSWLRANDG